MSVTFKEANNAKKDHKPKKAPLKKKSSISININVEENDNNQQEINVEQSFGGQTQTTKYFVSNGYVEKIFDNLKTDSNQIQVKL